MEHFANLWTFKNPFPKCEYFCNCGFQHLCQCNFAWPPRYIIYIVDIKQNIAGKNSIVVISVSQKLEKLVSTSPARPTITPPHPGEVHTDSVTVRWLAPPKLPSDVSSVSYQLVKDDELVASSISEEFYLAGDLAPNTNYEFRVKALTDTGLESQWSEPFSLKTLDEGDELSHFSETISGKIFR